MTERQTPSATMRLFVALAVPEAIKQELAGLQTAWQRSAGAAAAAVKWVRTDSVHLTLKFLGAVPAAQASLLRLALDDALRGSRPPTVRLSAAGVFPSPQRPRVLWVGLAGDIDALAALQERVERALAPLGFPPEGRFTPHLTLGRVRDDTPPALCRALGEALPTLGRPAGAFFLLDVVHLMRSELRPAGARYMSLAQVALER